MTWATEYDYDQAQQPQLSQFSTGNNDHLFDFVPEPTLQAQWCHPAVDGTYGESAHCSSAHAPSASSESISWGLFHGGHSTLSASSDPFASSSLFDPSFSWDSSMPSFNFGGLETSRCSGSEPSIPSENGRSDEMGVEGEQPGIAIERNTEASWGEGAGFEPDIIPLQASTQPGSVRPFFPPSVEHPMADPVLPRQKQAQAGWTYRQILEIVAFPPPDAPHLWHERIAQLAAVLGMPSGATGSEIIIFVIQVAAMKNDLDRVAPLVKAIGTAASVLEGRVVVPSELQSIFADLYPSAARAYGLKTTREAVDLNTTQTGHCAEVSHHVCPSYSSTRNSEYQYQISLALGQPSVSPIIDGDEGKEATGSEAEAEVAPQRPRSKFAEGDVYCRVGACLASFKDPRVCMKHRARHFPLAWRCPGPCRTQSTYRGRFVRDETLKRHLDFPRFASCRDAVLQLLGLESIPPSGRGSLAWMAPLRDGPERPWERPGSHLTDLETVKARLRDPHVAASPPVVPSISSRRK